MNSFSPFETTSDDNRPGSSTSGSDDGSIYAVYSDTAKTETDPEDENNSLTSQTLNADGTPKRPMNAFMIFARKRRPQVSAENQSMRTGEISKILSREWNNMPAIEKQFYLDQAKQLKDTFNSKYPDYVYRRRPNNSRKRRRTEVASSRASDPSHTSDGGEDVAPLGDLGESSHTDGEDSQVDSTTDTRFSRAPHDTRMSSFSYPPSELGYRQDNRTSFTPPEPLPHPIVTVPPPRPHSNPNYSYLQSNQTPTQSSVFTEQTPHNTAPWDPTARLRSVTSNWLGSLSHHDRPSITTSFSSLKPCYPSATSTSTPTSAWPSSASTSGVTSATTDTSSNYSSFSTLTSPFYPPQSISNVTSPDFTSPISTLAGQFGTSRPFGSDLRSYGSPPPPGAVGNQFPPSGREPSLFPQIHQRNSFTAAAGLPRSLPQSFGNIPPLESPPSNAEVPQISGYWARADRIEGH